MEEKLLPPVVSVAAVTLLLVTVPDPANEPIRLEYPAKSSVVKLETVMAELVLKAVVEPAFKVPALMVVLPLYVLFPERVKVPVLFFFNERVPAPFWIVPES